MKRSRKQEGKRHLEMKVLDFYEILAVVVAGAFGDKFDCICSNQAPFRSTWSSGSSWRKRRTGTSGSDGSTGGNRTAGQTRQGGAGWTTR